MFRVKQINSETVEPVKFVDHQADKRPVKGANIFPDVYCNIFCCARKKSGKTCAIAKIIDKCSTSETRIIAFVSTLHRDNTWRAIEKMCSERDISFTGFTSIKDLETKEDILESILKALGEPGKADDKNKEKELDTNPVLMGGGGENQKKKKKKPKEQAPKIIFIFDDLSGELLLPSITKLLKEHRHYQCKTIISSQYWNDIVLQARLQIDYILLYQGLANSIQKMKDIYSNLDLSVEFDQFMDLCSYATEERFHFLYINKVESTFRKDFTHEITVPESDERVL